MRKFALAFLLASAGVATSVAAVWADHWPSCC